MKNKSIIVILVIALIVLFVSIFVYKNIDTRFATSLTQIIPFINNQENQYDFSGSKVILINNSTKYHVKIKDKKKLEQITRKYSRLFEQPYQALKIVFSDERQDYGFSWSSGTPYSHSVFLHTIPYLEITIHIDPEVLANANWDRESINKETEGILLYALERALLNLNPETATTYTEDEENVKADNIEKNAQESFNQLNADNPNLLFEVSYD